MTSKSFLDPGEVPKGLIQRAVLALLFGLGSFSSFTMKGLNGTGFPLPSGTPTHSQETMTDVPLLTSHRAASCSGVSVYTCLAADSTTTTCGCCSRRWMTAPCS